MATPGVTLTGKLNTIAGSNDPGSVVITLCNFGDNPPLVTGTMMVSDVTQTVQAAADGTWSTTLWGNYQLTPANTFYQIGIYAAGSTAPTVVAAYQLNEAGTFALDSLMPLTVTVPPSPFVPIVANPSGSQAIKQPLNLLGGGTSATPDGDDDSTAIATTAFVKGQGYLTSVPAADWNTLLNKPSEFTPAAHNHTIADTTGLQAALDGKASSSHNHIVANVTGLQTALDGKAPLVDPTFTGTVNLKTIALKAPTASNFNGLTTNEWTVEEGYPSNYDGYFSIHPTGQAITNGLYLSVWAGQVSVNGNAFGVSDNKKYASATNGATAYYLPYTGADATGGELGFRSLFTVKGYNASTTTTQTFMTLKANSTTPTVEVNQPLVVTGKLHLSSTAATDPMIKESAATAGDVAFRKGDDSGSVGIDAKDFKVDSGAVKYWNGSSAFDTSVSRGGTATVVIGAGGAGDYTGTILSKDSMVSATNGATAVNTTYPTGRVQLRGTYWNGSASEWRAWTLQGVGAAVDYFDITPPSQVTSGAYFRLNNCGLNIKYNTAATSGANQSSPQSLLMASYWNGSAAANDSWTWQNILGSGTNPTSTLKLTHGGSSGVAKFQVESTVNTTVGYEVNGSALAFSHLSGSATAAQLPTFGTAAAGIVPASGGGTTNFLRADGTWAAPPAGGGGSVAWGAITGTLSAQTDLQTALNAKANTSSLATVATSGSYTDLTNKPTIVSTSATNTWSAAQTFGANILFSGNNLYDIGSSTNKAKDIYAAGMVDANTFQMGTTGTTKWWGTSSFDTYLSRGAAGVVCVGTTATAGDATGNIKLTSVHIKDATNGNTYKLYVDGGVLKLIQV